MAEKQHRKTSFIPSLKTLRNTFRKHIARKFVRSLSLKSNSTMQTKSASAATDEVISLSTSISRSPRSLPEFSTYHQPSLCSSDKPCEGKDGDEKIPEPLRDWKILQIRRSIPSLKTAEVLSLRQTTIGPNRHSAITSSRIPTPTKPPKDNLYSHSVYQTEGRRSVLSPVKRRSTIAHQEGSYMDPNDGIETRLPATQGYPAAQRQIFMFRKPAAEYKGNRNHKFERNMTPAPTQGLMPMRKVRVRRDGTRTAQYLIPRYCHDQFPADATATTAESTSKMTSPKRLKLTQAFEDLKKLHENPRTKLPMFKQSLKASPSTPAAAWRQTLQMQTQTHGQTKEKDAPATCLADLQLGSSSIYRNVDNSTPKTTGTAPSKLPLASSSSSARRKTQGDKMVSSLLQPMCPQNNPFSPKVQRSCLEPRRSMLTGHPNSCPQVETAMPSQYWLGRFMTLTNAFHYEDSFGEPDIATGFEIPSSFSRPFQGSDDGDLAAYRVKRAFMVLENMCATEEAGESLREFREGYIRRFGDRWMA
ncbi:hypothetical protein BJX64DRAFT_290186 [Aspergillus heterothallicus]